MTAVVAGFVTLTRGRVVSVTFSAASRPPDSNGSGESLTLMPSAQSTVTVMAVVAVECDLSASGDG